MASAALSMSRAVPHPLRIRPLATTRPLAATAPAWPSRAGNLSIEAPRLGSISPAAYRSVVQSGWAFYETLTLVCCFIATHGPGSRATVHWSCLTARHWCTCSNRLYGQDGAAPTHTNPAPGSDVLYRTSTRRPSTFVPAAMILAFAHPLHNSAKQARSTSEVLANASGL